MADFAAILNKTLGKMGQTTPQTRALVYDRARKTVRRQIDAMADRPPQAVVDRQFERLETAIAETEARYLAETAAAEAALSDEPLVPDVAPSAPAPDAAPPGADPAADRIEPSVRPIAEASTAWALPQGAPTVTDATDVEPAGQPEAGDPQQRASNRDPLLDFLNEQTAAMAREGEAPAGNAGPAQFGAADPGSGGSGSAEPDRYGAEDEDGGAVSGRRHGRLIIAVIVLVIVGIGAFIVFAQRGSIAELVGRFGTSDPGGAGVTANGEMAVHTVETVRVPKDDEHTFGEGTAATEDDIVATEIVDAGGGTADVDKYTQRLTPDGREIDEGPLTGTGQNRVGSSVAGQTASIASAALQEPAAAPAMGAQTADPGIAIGQETILYEERTGTQPGTANQGATMWSVVQEEPADGQPLEPAIRARSSIPELGLNMEMTIRRNGDPTFPASHIIELFFTVPDTFAGGGIADMQRIAFKANEQDPGNTLIGVPALIDTNIFLIALTDAPQAVAANVALMRDQNWIDIPMQYVNGRRALITLDKGAAGDRVFDEVFDAWGQAAPTVPAADVVPATADQ